MSRVRLNLGAWPRFWGPAPPPPGPSVEPPCTACSAESRRSFFVYSRRNKRPSLCLSLYCIILSSILRLQRRSTNCGTTIDCLAYPYVYPLVPISSTVSLRTAVVATFFSHNVVSCKASLILAIKNLRNKIHSKSQHLRWSMVSGYMPK